MEKDRRMILTGNGSIYARVSDGSAHTLHRGTFTDILYALCAAEQSVAQYYGITIDELQELIRLSNEDWKYCMRETESLKTDQKGNEEQGDE